MRTPISVCKNSTLEHYSELVENHVKDSTQVVAATVSKTIRSTALAQTRAKAVETTTLQLQQRFCPRIITPRKSTRNANIQPDSNPSKGIRDPTSSIEAESDISDLSTKSHK